VLRREFFMKKYVLYQINTETLQKIDITKPLISSPDYNSVLSLMKRQLELDGVDYKPKTSFIFLTNEKVSYQIDIEDDK
jgi:hypothetical protein